MTSPTENLARLRSFAEAYTAAWCSQDAARVAAFYAEDGSLSVNQDAPAFGRKAITAVAATCCRGSKNPEPQRGIEDHPVAIPGPTPSDF